MKLNKIYNMDCLEGMKQLEDESIDLVITDPPYHITSKNALTFVGSKRMSVKDRWGHWEKDSFEEYSKVICKVIDEGKRILKEDKCFLIWLRAEYGGYFARYAETIGFKIFASLIWHKPNPVPHIRKTNYRSSFEYCLVLCNGEKSKPFNFISQEEMTNVFTHPIGCYKKTSHPTEKPLFLFHWHLKVHSDIDDVVLDPFMGSGTTAVAAKQLNRNFIGFEINQAYVDIANKRLEQEPLHKFINNEK